jgi:hypothetical protein
VLSAAWGAWQAWSDRRVEQAARVLTLAACGTLFLQSSATLQLGYTLRVPYLLFACAVAVGAPFVVRGWTAAPPWLLGTGLALVAVYLTAAVVGPQDTLSNTRAGGNRDLVYLADLALGLASLGLFAGLWSGRSTRPLVAAVAAGAGVAALYALYQWPAQHYGLPLSDLNNTIDSNGISLGANQGSGLFGWQRVRGTFLEPHFLGLYLAACLPLAAWMALSSRGRTRLAAAVAVGLLAAALLLTVSVPPWGALSLATVSGGTLFAIGRGRAAAAGALGGAVVVIAVSSVFLVSSPAVLGTVTGRDAAELDITSGFRTQTWQDASQIWAERPVLGYGPGQSSIQLTRQLTRETLQGSAVSAGGLRSAQGLWAAALIDAGVLGFGVWALFLGSLLAVGGRVLVARPSGVQLATFVAAASIVISNEVAGDRIDTTVWALLGLLLATSLRRKGRANGGQSDEEPDRRTADRPSHGPGLTGAG